MYKIRKKVFTSGTVKVTNNGVYFIEMKDKAKHIIQMSLDGNELMKFDFVDINETRKLKFAKDYFIALFKRGETVFYSLNNKNMFRYNEILSFIFLEEDSQYIYMHGKEFLYRFNKEIKIMERFPLIDNRNLLLNYLLDDMLIFTLRGYLLYVYKSEIKDITLSWQLDIRSLFPEQEDVEFRDIKEYQGSLIVATTAAVLRLSVEDGSIIWISEGYARTIEIVGNTGYVCTAGSLFKVNLDNGEESGFGWGEYHKLPNFTYNGKDYWATGHRVVYHDGLLWYSVYSSGDSFLIAINPENGNYEWIHYVDTIGKTDAPQFFGDYMFLYDTEHTLHIYQKDS